MAPGLGRRMGGWAMLVGAVLIVAGVLAVDRAADALEAQAADLDASEERAIATTTAGAVGGVVLASGLLILLIASIVFAVGSWRMRRHGVAKRPIDGALAAGSGMLTLLALLFAFVLPSGPGALAFGFAAGGGGAAGAVQVQTFEGNLTAASYSTFPESAGPMNAENVHAFEPVALAGAVKVRIGSGGVPEGTYAIAVLEEADGAGGWREVARTAPGPDVSFEVPARSYASDVRIRVTLPEGAFGSVEYLLAISFDPTT